MKKTIVFALCLFALSGAARATTESDVPQLEKGWNLVSAPCGVSVDDFKQKIGNSGFDVFEWNGAGYVKVDKMVRGKGYALNNNAVLNPSSVCGEAEESETVSLELGIGWNLVGNPFHQSMSFAAAFGSAANLITQILEARGNKYVSLVKTDHIKPFRGYWVYAASPATVNFMLKADCDALIVNNYLPTYYSANQNTAQYRTNFGFKLYASCFVMYKVNENYYYKYSKDLSGEVEWAVSDEAILKNNLANSFETLDKEGEATVTAKYKGQTSISSLKVKAFRDKLVSIRIFSTDETSLCEYDSYIDGDYEDYCIDAGTTMVVYANAYYSFSGYSSENIAQKVKWNISSTSTVSIDSSGKITGLATGTASVNAELNGITSNKLTVMVGKPSVDPVEGPGGIKIAVTRQSFDDMSSILYAMGYTHAVLKTSYLSSADTLAKFDAIFINCDGRLQSTAAEAKKPLKDFVYNGGELYMSDWAYIFLHNMFPEIASFLSYSGSKNTVSATITDAGLSAYMDGKTATNIMYDLGGWVPIKSVSEGVTTYLKGNCSAGTDCDGPLMISLKYGKGRIIFTTFHNEPNVSNDVKKILEYMALIPITGNLATANEEVISTECDCAAKDNYINTIGSGQTKKVALAIKPGAENLIAVNGASGGDFSIEIYSPDGKLYSAVNVGANSKNTLGRTTGRVSFKTPSTGGEVALLKIPADAAKGNWSFKITGENMPDANMPVVVTLGAKK